MIRWKKQELVNQLEQTVSVWNNVAVGEHDRGGREFMLHGKEIGHIHWNGDLDILFSKTIRDELLKTGKVQVHKWVPESGWTTFPVTTAADIPAAAELLRLSYLQKRKRQESISVTEELAPLNFSEVVKSLI